jgi:hypothetical protein
MRPLKLAALPEEIGCLRDVMGMCPQDDLLWEELSSSQHLSLFGAFKGLSGEKLATHVVERLLASPTYGERWGRHWLDLVRYADTAGETGDYPATLAWKYRNYVIAAFTADKPYDRFLREQLAGVRQRGAEPRVGGVQRLADVAPRDAHGEARVDLLPGHPLG